MQDSLVRVFFVSGVENRCGGGMGGVPCKLFVVDVHLLESQREREGERSGGRTMTIPSAAGIRDGRR